MGVSVSEIEIAQRLDALDAGEWRAFLCTDGKTLGISLRAEIRSGHVLRSTQGYGDTLGEALRSLYNNLTVLDEPSDYVVVNAGRADRRAVRWNGGGWKPVFEVDRAQQVQP
ncbi:MAG: hypothetical protein IE912_03110 [Brevundimonas diminuta]|nr:hypothetical protein [Brevundimonas diminuta]MBD3817890.1 hypothetical protein [Brevundimonas diminuta]